MPAVESAEALKEKLAKILIGRARSNADFFMSFVKLMSLTLLPKCCFKNANVQQFLFQILTTTLLLEVVAPAFG
jgi:hypothetical protein